MNGITQDIKAGATHIAVGDEGGKVILKFPRPVQWIALDPDVAPMVAEQMINAAVACGVKVEIPMPGRELSDIQKAALEGRVKFVMNNLLERKVKQERIAKELVDIILKAVL